jgi:methionyl-tRNA formyltransferase
VRLVFAGTPAAALPTLRALAASRHQVAAVVTRPDAPVGRGKKIHRSPVAELAEELGLETLKPGRPNEGWFLERLRAIAPDCCPVTAYGALLPQSALDIPAHGWVNLHFSVLPAWRGAAPVQHAVLRGDDITGATTFLIVKELDAGPVYGTLTEPIRPADTSGDLLERLAVSGAELLVRTLDGIEDGTVRAVPQPGDGVSLAPKLTPADARVDWKLPAHLIDRQLRACTPDPGAWTEFGTGHIDPGRLKLWPVTLAAGAGLIASSDRAAGGRRATGAGDAGPGPAQPDDFASSRGGKSTAGLAPGELLVDRNAVYVGTGTVPVRLGDVQPQGKRRMPAADWARGLRLAADGTPAPASRRFD